MIDAGGVAENIMAAVDDSHIETGLPLYLDGGDTRTETAVMGLKPLVSTAGFSIVLSNGEVYEVRVEKVR